MLSRERPTLKPSSFWVMVTRGRASWATPWIWASRRRAFARRPWRLPKYMSSTCSVVRRSRPLTISRSWMAMVRNLRDERQEIAAVEDEDLRGGERARISGPRLAVEQGDLAEDLVRRDEVEHDLATVFAGDADLDHAGDHGKEAETVIALGEDPLACGIGLLPRVRGKLLENRTRAGRERTGACRESRFFRVFARRHPWRKPIWGAVGPYPIGLEGTALGCRGQPCFPPISEPWPAPATPV